MRTLLVATLVVGLFTNAFAAVPKKVANPKIKKSMLVEDALKLQIEDRIQALRMKGPNSYRDLRKIAFSAEKPYELRWRAVMSMAWLGGKESVVDLEKAVEMNDWYMRDAALKGLQKVNKDKAIVWAKKLLNDPALVVRTAAVRVIHDLNDTSSEALLWEKLNAPENFRGDQSLWIRRHIVAALSDFAAKGTEQRFAKLLNDKDKTLYVPAMRGLERLTGKFMDEDPKKALALWKTHLAKM